MMPFAGGIEANANATLIFSLAAAIAYGLALHQPIRLTLVAAKTMAVGMLAVLTVMQGGSWLLAAALGLSAIGDALLSRDGQKAFLGGLASFLAAHIVYGVAFFHLGDGAGVLFSQPWRAAMGIVMVIGAFGIVAALRQRVAPFLRLPVAVFSVAVLVMGLSALTMNSAVIVAGSALLMASGGLFASEKLLAGPDSPHRAWMPLALWVVYYAGQAAITLGVLLA